MKKLIALFIFLFSVSFAFADLYPYKRFFESGVNADTRVSQSLITVSDFNSEDLVLDFTELADSLSDKGFIVETSFNTNAFVNLNFKDKLQLGVFANVSGYVESGLGQGLFDFLGYGNAETESLIFDVCAGAEVFVEAGMSIKMKFKDLGIKLTPSYYIPLLYIPHTSAKAVISSEGDETFNANGNISVPIYSIVDLNLLFDENLKFNSDFSFDELSTNVLDYIQQGGISMRFDVEFPLIFRLDFGVYADIPIISGSLKNKSVFNANFSASMPGILSSAGSEEEDSLQPEFNGDYSLEDCTDEDFSVRKPLRIGAETTWRPFGPWCTFRGKLGLAARNPFSKNYDPTNNIFLEYYFATELELFYVLHMNFASSYTNKFFEQSFNLGFNFRAAQIYTEISAVGTDFSKSFGISGVKVNVGTIVGF